MIFRILSLLFFLSALTAKGQTESEPTDNKTDSKDSSTPAWVPKKGAYNPEQERFFDLIHTRLELKPNMKAQEIEGKAMLEMSPWFYDQDSVHLDAVGFEIKSVSMNGKVLTYHYDSRTLSVALGKPFSRKDTLKLHIEYTAHPTEVTHAENEAQAPENGLYFINPKEKIEGKPVQIWTQGETENNSCWFPTFDAPNVKTTQEILLTVEQKYTTLSNGALISSEENEDGTRTDHWRQSLPHAPYLFMIAVGEFEIIKDKWRDKDVTYYMEKEYAEYARVIFGKTPQMIEFYSELFDFPYPWEKYAQVVVRDFVSGAMENTSASVFMEGLNVDARSINDSHWEGIISHELIHQWFGNIVTCESWANLAVNESFANYGEYLWQEHAYGRDEADQLLLSELDNYLYEASYKRESIIRYFHLDKEDMFDSHSYSKGCLVLHMLRNELGDDAFFAGIQSFLKIHAYKPAEIHDLRIAFEDVTGRDLNWFFNQWFMSAGHPVLEVSNRYEDGKLIISTEQKQDLRYSPVFQLPVQTEVWVKGKKMTLEMVLDKQKQDFVFPLEAEPELVLFDAEGQLLAEITHEKTLDEWIFQFRNAENYRQRQYALDKIAEESEKGKVREVLEEGLKDDFWVIRAESAGAFEAYAGKNKKALVEMLHGIMKSDSNSSVRATALETIITIGEYREIMEEALNDTSYFVLSNALYGFMNFYGKDAVETTEKFEELDERHIVAILASYYATFQIKGKYDWYASKLENKSGSELHFLLPHFASYILMQADGIKQKGIKCLMDLAKHDNYYKTRIEAYEALHILKNFTESNLEETLTQMKRKEKDKRVLIFLDGLSF